MFIPPRFVVIDDKEAHLQAIVQTFRNLGTLCCGLHYRPEEDIEAAQLRGVRALFMDLHLNEGAVPGDHTQHFATIAAILEDHVTESGGPFVLVMWTEKEEEVAGLIKYLDEKLDPDKPWCRPITTLSLSKTAFLVEGMFDSTKADELKAAVMTKLETAPEIAALLSWEGDVVEAASSTLKALVDQVPSEARNQERFRPALALILKRLARAAVGRKNAKSDPRAAMNAVLGPILSDRIIHTPAPLSSNWWAAALVGVDKSNIGPVADVDQAATNRMLHIAHPNVEPAMKGSDWGVVSASFWKTEETAEWLGVTQDQLLENVFKLEGDSKALAQVVLVRVGATCDHAQGRVGPIPYYVGVVVPCVFANNRTDVPKAEWKSPALSLDGFDGPQVLAVNARFPVTLAPKLAADLTPLFRLREQLLMEVIVQTGTYQTRPGIVALNSNG